MNRYLSTIILLTLLGNMTEMSAQSLQPAPRLVVNIAVDQLRTDYIEHFAPLYGEEGFKRLLQKAECTRPQAIRLRLLTVHLP